MARVPRIVRIVWAMGDEETWNRPLDLGTSDAVFVEDCTFHNGDAGHERNCIDGHQNARYVFRFNRVEGAYVETHGFCCHLTRGAFSLEAYGNVLDGIGEIHYRPFSLRGGTGVIFGNRIETLWSNEQHVEDSVAQADLVIGVDARGIPLVHEVQDLWPEWGQSAGMGLRSWAMPPLKAIDFRC